MKRILYYLCFGCFFFIGFKSINAQTTLDLKNPVISFEKIPNFGLQGFTVVKNYLFIILEGKDDTESIIKVYDLNNFKEVMNYKFGSLGHANDVTYNSKSNKIYVIGSSGSKYVYCFDADNFKYLDKFQIELPVRSITYIDDKDIYAVRTISSGFLLDNEFNLINKFPFIVGMNINTDIGKQGWAYYNDLLYYSTWSWIRRGGDGVNIIYVYGLDGKLKDSFHTDNKIGELENIAFHNNKMILGFNGYDKNIKFYISDIPDVSLENNDDVNKSEKEENINKHNFERFYIICGFIIISAVIRFFYKG